MAATTRTIHKKGGEKVEMARPTKAGLDYLELDCHMNEKVRLIQAEFGLKGFAVVVKLYQKIYGEFGYYCEWTDDSLLLFMSENGVSSRDEKNLIKEIVSACIRRNIFSEKLFKEFSILTSEGVQKRYLNAVSRREKVELKKEYLLISVCKNQKNVVINSINVSKNQINEGKNKQSREEKSKEENINTVRKNDAQILFERLWKLYPEKKGKGQVSETQKKRLLNIGFEEMSRAIERYKEELKRDADWRRPQNGSTFFNSGYIDYLDENYSPSKSNSAKKNQFNNFEQRDYSGKEIANLEKELLKTDRSKR